MHLSTSRCFNSHLTDLMKWAELNKQTAEHVPQATVRCICLFCVELEYKRRGSIERESAGPCELNTLWKARERESARDIVHWHLLYLRLLGSKTALSSK